MYYNIQKIILEYSFSQELFEVFLFFVLSNSKSVLSLKSQNLFYNISKFSGLLINNSRYFINFSGVIN